MAKTLQFRRDSTANLASVTGAVGEIFIDTTKKTVVVMDGSTPGGFALELQGAGTGATGVTGASGVGSNGATGVTGASGTIGVDGATGSAGTNGATGATGSNGTNGATGSAGTDGATGVTGASGVGATGPQGAAGATGAAGTNGTNGATGPQGASGPGANQALDTTSGVQHASLGIGTGTLGATGEIRATNEITAYYSSDERLKENILPIDNALGKLRQLKGVMFDWKDDVVAGKGGEDGYFVRKHDTGVIAQEVEAVLPEVVAERADGFKAVRYEKLAGLIIQAINELADQVDALKK
jgi:hypothetical protein